jgi:hypothetical protein
LLSAVSSQIIKRVRGINRVVYDILRGKPLATIEREDVLPSIRVPASWDLGRL